MGETGVVRTGLAIAVLVGTWASTVTIAWAGSYPTGGLVAALVAAVLVGLTGSAWLVLAIGGLARRWIPLALTMTIIAAVIIGGAGLAARIELPHHRLRHLLLRAGRRLPGLGRLRLPARGSADRPTERHLDHVRAAAGPLVRLRRSLVIFPGPGAGFTVLFP
ncbi:MAG TPA: hypothetical protein VIT65_00060 [Microlunatus sp.]